MGGFGGPPPKFFLEIYVETMPPEQIKTFCYKNTGGFLRNTGDFIKIKENSLISQNTGGNADFTGVTGDYRRSCHAWNWYHRVLVLFLLPLALYILAMMIYKLLLNKEHFPWRPIWLHFLYLKLRRFPYTVRDCHSMCLISLIFNCSSSCSLTVKAIPAWSVSTVPTFLLLFLDVLEMYHVLYILQTWQATCSNVDCKCI